MNERLCLNHLHDLRAGIALTSGDIPTATTFSRPDYLTTGRVIETSEGGFEIPGLPHRRSLEHYTGLGASRKV